MPSTCAPARVIWPPPPSFSSIICTFISPIDLPLIHILSPKFPITNDAVISLIVYGMLPSVKDEEGFQ